MATGLAKRDGESESAYLRHTGRGLIGIMRKRVCITKTGGILCSIGGKCDLIVLSAKGSTFETLHVWREDKIGVRIDPFGTAAPVASMNRRARRAAKRGAGC